MKNIFSILLSVLLPFVFWACSAAPTITKVTSLVPLSDDDKKVSKNGITIEITPINPTNVLSYTDLQTKVNVVEQIPLLGPVNKEQQINNVLLGLTFALNITNNTGHIIKMAGSDVGLTAQSKDIKKLGREHILQIWAADPKYVTSLPTIQSAIMSVPYWDEALRILPGKTILAYVSFDVMLKEGIGQTTLSVYDLVTNTDNAGNPTERTNFDFNLKELTSVVTNQ
ncbi:MAG: hypothetical protein WCA84_05160 [Ignavibacteriaceae bacterium]